MRRFAWPLIALMLSLSPAALGQEQAAKDLPHAFLFGSWIGGTYPPPTTLSGKECLASPTIIFTRDVVIRANPFDVSYLQRLVETVRDSGRGGIEFRLFSAGPTAAQANPFGFGPLGGDTGFGCGDPAVLRVQKRGENEIAFPNCSEFPYPLVRCPAN